MQGQMVLISLMSLNRLMEAEAVVCRQGLGLADMISMYLV